ncbi:bifunctional helix-turn-helix transcriptional regulator/GNAT family N-acetyltransferase [Hamadaea tsunoensis]|uniref:bifunctional helix-turn-helix transcriptional regulator/GNAT family N-acetyltransferase n=1 Tax=Hamadaea tsunoensis TaxID=53368 RepID=UPI000481551D|nr:helix-turn-helix domain-containing GNAT family N-acetyltransferase [Hamadaea tsunoensis]
MDPVTTRVREFNRFYTSRIGVLTDRYLGRRPLGEARLLYEIGGGADLGTVRARLGLDSGYLSRLLRSLERQGLVELSAHPADARAKVATLTAAGLAELSEQDVRAERSAADLIAPLSGAQRQTLDEALTVVQRLLKLAAVTISAAPAGSGDGRECLLAYAAELSHRFPEGYSPADLSPPADLEPPRGLLFVARDDTGPVGCVGLHRLDPTRAEVRHMWVDQRMRRTGLGGRLLSTVEEQARADGATTVVLNTHNALPEAVAMYPRLGYTESAPYGERAHAQRFFTKPL